MGSVVELLTNPPANKLKGNRYCGQDGDDLYLAIYLIYIFVPHFYRVFSSCFLFSFLCCSHPHVC